MTESGADEADVKKQREVLEETKAMIPECRNRLDDLVADLEAQVAEISEAGGDDASGTVFTEAQAFLKEVLGDSAAAADDEEEL